MNTFFEKLAGSATSTPSIQTAGLARAPLRAIKRATPSTGTSPTPPVISKPEAEIDPEMKVPFSLKEEDEEKPLHLTSPKYDHEAHEDGADEDGELTVDIYDQGDAIIIQSTVAGVKPEDLDVSITSDTVTIKGKRMREGQASESAYYYKELFWGTFSRSVILPEEIDDDTAEANLKNGMLTLRLPKKRHGIAQKIKVKAL